MKSTRARMIYKNKVTGERIEVRKPATATYVYDTKEGTKTITQQKLREQYTYMKKESKLARFEEVDKIRKEGLKL